ncbi:MAG: sigma-70 family RNA polymerase sigma factor [Clostridiaceae bacterium]
MQQLAVNDSLNQREIKKIVCAEEELTNIFNNYYKRVYNYIYYRVNCDYTAEDLTSQVFEKIMVKIETYSEGKAPFEVWVFAIARNVVNDYFRSLKKHQFFSLDAIKELVSKEKTPESMVVTAETNAKLSKALDILNKRERNIVALKFGANIKNKEIAQILNISESNVGVILYRTMKKLKSEMEKGE